MLRNVPADAPAADDRHTACYTHCELLVMHKPEIEPYRQTVDDVLTALGADPRSGLSRKEAQERFRRYGPNELPAEQPAPWWRKFLAQFADMLVILLIVACIISAGVWLHDRDTALPYEAIAIFAIVLLNALIGYVQQARAEHALAALHKLSATQARVIRDSARHTLLAAELVPGDIILVEQGDIIPADARIVESTALQTAEAALTGESLPAVKDVAPIGAETRLGDQRNMIFSGTVATYGRGRAVVTATGMQTQMGRIAGMIQRAPEDPTPLQRELEQVGKALSIVVVIVAIVVIAAIFLVEEVRGFSAIFDVLIFGVALAVAAVPEGLPAVVTATLSLGVHRMAKRNAIVRRLAAVETLGSANVIASDKTGTLTRNEMTVRLVVTAAGRVTFSGTGYVPEGEAKRQGNGPIDRALRSELAWALTIADRANNAVLEEHRGQWRVQGDPTEGALLVAARKAGLQGEALESRFPRRGELPFSSERKLMTTIHSDSKRQDGLIALTKGAPDVLLARCSHELVGEDVRPLTADRRLEILKINEELAADALRTLAVGFRPFPDESLDLRQFAERVEYDLVFVGLIGMIDPPREEAKEAVARAISAGIRPIMITGDHPKTAAVIAAELGIAPEHRVITGAELADMPEAVVDNTVREVSVYARVDPEHKLRIVRALQRDGMTVAMTGDGVNDAPALKVADIGVAMGLAGTDVSRQAADMVLADDNFATIVVAVEEGRAIFANIRKFLRYLLSSNTGEVMTMFFGVVLASVIGLTPEYGSGLVFPLSAPQILWINLVTDGAPALALAVDPPDVRMMQKRPRPRAEPVITRRMWTDIFSIGLVMAFGTLLVLEAALPGGVINGSRNMHYARTMAFTTLVLFQLFNVFGTRSEERSALETLFTNRWLWVAVALSLLLQAAVVYTPFLQVAFSTTALNASDWLYCTAVASSVLWFSELRKVITRAHCT
jgi:Ca2+-transporting ATPase